MKWNAEKFSETCGRVTEQGNKLVDILRNMDCEKVLDIGCGTGVLANEISKFSNEVIGIDSSAEMIEKAKTSFPRLNFILMDACSLTWNEYFNVVFSNAVFHFIRTQDMLLKNIHKVLLKNGSLVCEFGARGNILNLLNAMTNACNKRGKLFTSRFFYPSDEEYKILLEKNGFSVDLITIYDLDTQLKEGESGLRNWINQIFSIEMKWFDASEWEKLLEEIEFSLKPAQWDGSNWHLANRRIRVLARRS